MAGRVYISVVDNSERSTFTVSDLYPSLRIGSNRQFGKQSSIEFAPSWRLQHTYLYLQRETKYNGCKLGGRQSVAYAKPVINRRRVLKPSVVQVMEHYSLYNSFFQN